MYKVYFCGIDRDCGGFLLCGGVRSRQVCPFAGLFAEKSGSRNIAGQFNRRYIKLREIEEVRADCAKNKYGKPYSYDTLTLVTAQESFKIKNADNPSAAKQRIEELKAQSERSGVWAQYCLEVSSNAAETA